jgi:LysR family transcriptional activator of nhaA
MIYIHRGMERLNYHHLLYFFTVAREGSVARASARLGLKQPTVSAQIHALERKLGRKLLERSGRGLKVTPAGETVLRYAASIFALGGELLTALDGHAEAAPRLAVGVSDSFPSALAALLLPAVFGLKPRPLVTLVEASSQALAAQLAARSLHFVLADEKLANGAPEPLHSHLLLESSVAMFAPPVLARRARKDFPSRLAGAPVLLPSPGALRHEVDAWLTSRRPQVEKLAEMPHPELYALPAGAAIFAPSLLREPLRAAHGLLFVGELEGARWRAFLVTARRGAKQPAVEAVIGAAKRLR